VLKLRYLKVGVLRNPATSIPGPPSGTARPSLPACACAGSWQVAQDCRPEADRLGSKNIFLPSAAAGESEGAVDAA
jgi:hypothetical protein